MVAEVDLIDTIVEDEERHGKIEKQIYTVIPSNVEEIKFNLFEADGVVLSTFEYFYDHFGKDEMGHILVHLKDTYQGLGFH